MSDLISRESIVTLLEQYGYIDKEMERDLEAIPSADTLEHARAIKEYCEGFPECEGCRFYKGLPFRCTFGMCPQGWNLHEGEKE